MTHILFWRPQNENGCFSNWYKSPFTEEKINYQDTEQYMMAKKALLFDDREMCEVILKTTDPRKIRELGRKVKNFDETTWNKHKNNIMIDGLTLKFTQDKNLLKKLLETKNKILVEASPFDKIWGAGLSAEDIVKNKYKFHGENLLGKCLMTVRKSLE